MKLHVDRLLEMEYVIPHRGGGRRVEYELLYDGRGREGHSRDRIEVQEAARQA